MITKFLNLPSSKICIVSIKICFNAIHNLQSLKNLCLLYPPLILRLHTGCRLDVTFSKSVADFQKLKELKYYGYYGYKCLSISFCAFVRNILKIVTLVIEKMKLAYFSMILDAPPPPPPARPKMHFGQLYVAI